MVVHIAYLYVLCNGLRHTIEHTLEIVQLPRQLHFNYYYLSLGVLCLDVNTVELCLACFLIAFALKQFGYNNLLTKKHRNQSFQHCKICLVAQHALHRPVKSNVFVLYFHSYVSIVLFCKSRNKKRHYQTFLYFIYTFYQETTKIHANYPNTE